MSDFAHQLDQRSGDGAVVMLRLTYVECDVPDGMTLRQWRRSRAAAAAPERRPWRTTLRALAVGRRSRLAGVAVPG